MQLTREKVVPLMKPIVDGEAVTPQISEIEAALLEHANQTPVDMPLYLEALLARYVLEQAAPLNRAPARGSAGHVRVVAQFNAEPFVLENRCLTVNEGHARLPLAFRDALARTVLGGVEITRLSVNPLQAEYQMARSQYTVEDLKEGFAHVDGEAFLLVKAAVDGKAVFPAGGR